MVIIDGPFLKNKAKIVVHILEKILRAKIQNAVKRIKYFNKHLVHESAQKKTRLMAYRVIRTLLNRKFRNEVHVSYYKLALQTLKYHIHDRVERNMEMAFQK